MVDQYGRKIDYLRISLTDRCNMRCIYCMPEVGIPFIEHENILTYEEIVTLCSFFSELGITKLKITGGEPLLRKNVETLIKKCYEIQGIEEITITTNGVLLKEKLPSLYEAGIRKINVSLDTLNEDTFREITRTNYFRRVIEGIEEALTYEDIKLKINCVPLVNNKQDILSLIRMAKNNSICVRFIEMMPIGMGKEVQSMHQEDIERIIREKYGTLIPWNEKEGNGPAIYYSLTGFKGKIGFISALSHKYCGACNRIRLASDGTLKTCLQYNIGCDLKEALRSHQDKEKIIRMIKKCIEQKPKEHHFIEKNQEIFDNVEMMSKIGG